MHYNFVSLGSPAGLCTRPPAAPFLGQAKPVIAAIGRHG